MSQKINPVSNKLGILQLWKHNNKNYGVTYKVYNKFIQPRNYIFKYLSKYLNLHFFLLEDIYILQGTHQATIKIFSFDLNSQPVSLKIKDLVNVFSTWLNCPVTIRFYKNKNLSNSALLLSNYMFYLITQKSNSPKKVLQLIYKVLQTKINKTKIIYTHYGIKIIKLVGFKIEISGCFESSRSQMSKVLKVNLGSSPLTKLNGYIDYSNKTFFTKFGSCGFKIWLFYKLINS